MVPKGGIPVTSVTLPLLLHQHYEDDINVFEGNISSTIDLISIMFNADIHSSHLMNCHGLNHLHLC